MESERLNRKQLIHFPVMQESVDSGWINEVKCTIKPERLTEV